MAPARAPLVVSSPSFAPGGRIPRRHTGEGADVSPELGFSGVDPRTRSLVLLVDDPDAPDPRAPKMTWVHWILYSLPPTVTRLAEGISPAALPTGTGQGITDFGGVGWGGPNPPTGRHRYFFHLHALDVVLPELGSPTRAQLEAAMRGHVIASAQVMGTYQRGDP